MKYFLKSISIYGLLPIIGKFSGFLLIPVYARVFSSPEFGTLELIVTLIKFLLFVCNLEIYTSIGRYFYERETLEEKANLISTGLIITIASTLFVTFLVCWNQKLLLDSYIKSDSLSINFTLITVWLFVEAVATYISVIPRYENKPKLFVVISTVALFLRIASTLLFILVFDMGLNGVLLGHIVGASATLVLNFIACKKYFKWKFSFIDAKSIITFALPIVPGVLLVGFWNPLSRELVSSLYSLYALGLLAFGFRIASVLEILNGSIRMAWNPLIFEKNKSKAFKKDITNISLLIGNLAFTMVIVITLLSPEISLYVGTAKYEKSAILIGMLSLAFVYEMLKKMRGFSPLLNNKTSYLTYTEIVGITIGALLLFVFEPLGLLGLGLAFLLPAFFKCMVLTTYTSITESIKLYHLNEIVLTLIFILSTMLVYLQEGVVLRLMVVAITVVFSFFVLDKQFALATKSRLLILKVISK